MFRAWAAVELDLQDKGIDIEDPALDSRPWRWWELRITSVCLTPGTRTHAVLSAPSGE